MDAYLVFLLKSLSIFLLQICDDEYPFKIMLFRMLVIDLNGMFCNLKGSSVCRKNFPRICLAQSRYGVAENQAK